MTAPQTAGRNFDVRPTLLFEDYSCLDLEPIQVRHPVNIADLIFVKQGITRFRGNASGCCLTLVSV